ncbi:MAG TPA: AAA-like domain-containing protein [Halomicronema sp.]
MTLDQVIQLIRAKEQKDLNPVQKLILSQVWEGQTYSNIASSSHYGEQYLRNIASALWQLLSEMFNIQLNKANFRTILETRCLTTEEQELIEKFLSSQNPLTSQEFPDGPVPIASPFYIERPPIEQLCYQQITKPGSILRIKAPRKMGKSSLILRILSRAVSLNYQTVTLDFQQAEANIFDNLDKFLRWFCSNISRQLNLTPKLNDYWDEDMGSKVSCTLYFQAYILENIKIPIILALNEVNRLFEYPTITAEFLPLLRSWHEEAKRIETLQKLRIIVLHSTEVYIPLKLNQSPFNVGLPVTLPYFTKEQVITLARRHELDWTNGTEADRLMAIIGGHPYLIRLALYHLREQNFTLSQLLEQAPTMGGIYKEYLRNLWATLQEYPELYTAIKQIIKSDNGVVLEPIIAYKLESLGVVKINGNTCYLSCELYRQYLVSSDPS